MDTQLLRPRSEPTPPVKALRPTLRAFVSRHWNGGAAIAILVLGTVISWARLPETARATLWAEDARNFLGNAVSPGPVLTIFRPYAGYLQTVPRIVAGITTQFFPISDWAYAMAGGACLVTAGVAALIFLCSRDIVSSLPGRLALASVTLLVPLSPREVLGNTANVHWYFLWLAPWLVLYLPRSRVGAWLLGVVALLAASSEIQMALFLPLLLWDRKNRQRMPVRFLFVVGIALQVVATTLAPRGASTADPIRLASIGYGYLINAVLTIWLPNSSAIGRVLTTAGPWGAFLFLVPFLAAAVWGLRNGSRLQRIIIVTLLASSVAIYVAAVTISPGTFYDYAAMPTRELAHPWIARYGVVPSMFLLAIVPVAATVRRRGTAIAVTPVRRRLPRSALQSVTAMLLITLMLLQFVPGTTRRASGPELGPQVVAARQLCAAAPPAAVVRLAGAPSLTWSFAITCGRLEHER